MGDRREIGDHMGPQHRTAAIAAAALLTGALLAGGIAVAQGQDAPVWTGCLSVEDGKIYDVALGESPMKPCKAKDMPIRLGSGDITAVLAGDGLLGGADSGDATLGVDWESLDERYAGPVAWADLVGVPGDIADGDQTGSPLTGVECNAGKYVVGFDVDGNAMCSDGEIAEPPPDPWVPPATLDGWRTRASNQGYTVQWQLGAADPDTGALGATHVLVHTGDACAGDPYAQVPAGGYWDGYRTYRAFLWDEGLAGTTITWRAAVLDGAEPLVSTCSEPHRIPVPEPMELTPDPTPSWSGPESVMARWQGTWADPDGTVRLTRVDAVEVWTDPACSGEPVGLAVESYSLGWWEYVAPWTDHAPGTELYARSRQGAFNSACAGPVTWLDAPEPPATTPRITSVVNWYAEGDGWTEGDLEVFEGATCEGTRIQVWYPERDTTAGTFRFRFDPYLSVPPVGPGDSISARARIQVSTTDCTSYAIPVP